MRLLVPYQILKTKYFSSPVFNDVKFDLNVHDVRYVFDEFIYGEYIEDISSDYYLDKVLDTRLYSERGLGISDVGIVAEEIFPALLDELKSGFDGFSLSGGVFEAIDLTSSGFVINLKFPLTTGRL